jgi:flavin-dependent dehydrogenase
MVPQRIAVVGGGPAGAFAAARLASRARSVVLFDDKLAWEKPCGGGLTDKAVARWPFLRELPVQRNWITNCELIAPSGAQVRFALEKQMAIFSRLTLNGLLLERATKAGAQVIPERVLEVERKGQEWKIQSSGAAHSADFLVMASGARNPFRTIFSPHLGPENFLVALGYYIPGTSSTVQVKFLEGLHGYIWIFPRADHFSAGICGRMEGRSTAELRRVLEDHLPGFGLSPKNGKFYAHVLPSLTPEGLGSMQLCGDGWALIGDAAGLVDAVTGEGLYYALRSAEILSEAILSGQPNAYAQTAGAEILCELKRAAGIAGRFYSGEWLGGSVLERMVLLTGSSTRFRQLMGDLISGAQEYSNLKQRVYRSLPKIAAEALVSTLWRENAPSSRAAVAG